MFFKAILWLAVPPLGNVGVYPFQEEFADQIRHRICAHTRQTIEDDQRSSAIGSRVVKIRNGCRREVPKYARVIRLPPPVITPGDHCGRHRVQRARPDTPLPFVEVAWVLMKDRRIYSSAQQGARYVIRERSAVSLSISFYSATVRGEDVLILLRPCN